MNTFQRQSGDTASAMELLLDDRNAACKAIRSGRSDLSTQQLIESTPFLPLNMAANYMDTEINMLGTHVGD